MGYFIVILLVVVVIIGIAKAKDDEKRKKERGEEMMKRISTMPDFTPSTKIVGVDNLYTFMVDNTRKKICYINSIGKRIIPFDKILKVELIENGTTISSKSTIRTVGGSFIGGAIAGGAGAVVGGLSGNSKNIKKISSVQVKITIREINDPSFIIDAFNAQTMTIEGKPIKPDSLEGYKYKQGLTHANRIVDILRVVIDEVDNHSNITANNIQQNTSIADELKKLADLKRDGILTQEEFDIQKAKLLNVQNVNTNNVQDVNINNNENQSFDKEDFPARIQELIDKKQFILAVKEYKDLTGVSLSEAKDVIDAHKR